jgi:hypothetical protein
MNGEDMKYTGEVVVRVSSLLKIQNVCKLFTNHPNKNGMTYREHFKRAMWFSWNMGYGACCLVIHAFFPFLCEKTGSTIIKELYDAEMTHIKKN